MAHEQERKLADDVRLTEGSSASAPSSDGEQAVTLAGQFSIVSKLGEGGIGVVYKARNVITGKFVAIKVLKPGANETAFKRFLQEAEAACLLEHPNIVQCLDAGFHGGVPYILMELVDGETLAQRLARENKLPLEQALPLFRQLVAAIARAHARGIVHRDLKPQNVIFAQTESGEVAKILDFGIAKIEGGSAMTLTQTGEVFGTPLYMSPEQMKGDKVDARSDIYSLGAVMYETLSGVPPHSGQGAFELMHKRLTEKPAPFENIGVSVPPALERIILKCLDLDAGNRYNDGAALASDLDRFDQSKKLQLPAVPRFDRRSFPGMAVALVVCLLIIAGFAAPKIWKDIADSKQRTEIAKRISQERAELLNLLERADSAYRHSDTTQAKELYSQAEAFSRSHPETASIGTDRHIAFGQFKCAEANRDVKAQLGYLNILLHIADEAGAGGSDVESNNRLDHLRRMQENVLEQIGKNAYELTCNAHYHYQNNQAAQGQLDYLTILKLFEAAWVVLNERPSEAVLQKLQNFSGTYVEALHYIFDEEQRRTGENNLIELAKRLQRKSSKGRIYQALGEYALLAAAETDDPKKKESLIEKARKYCTDGLSIFTDEEMSDPGNSWGLYCLEGLARVDFMRKNYREAIKESDRELQILRRKQADPLILLPRHIATAYARKGWCYEELGDKAQAAKNFAACWAICKTPATCISDNRKPCRLIDNMPAQTPAALAEYFKK